MKEVISRAFLLIAVVFGVLASCSHPVSEIKIACVGNSITEGAGIEKQSNYSYPVFLDNILGAGYSVLNCGRSAATMLKNGNLPYWYTNEFSNVFAFQPDMIVIKLGTNDTKLSNWNQGNFMKDYQAMIDTFQTIPTKPKIFICLPVPVYEDKWTINDSTLQAGVLPAIRGVARANNLPLIDLFSALSNHPEYFPDGIHPDEKGAKLMAETVAKTIIETK
jgi:alpha-L-fucosidase 2